MGFIYCVTFPDGKKYIGQTRSKRSIKSRIYNHKHSKTETLISKAFQLYQDNYTVNVVLEIENDLLNENEIKYIKEYNTLAPNGYNTNPGGGVFTHTTYSEPNPILLSGLYNLKI